MLGLELHELGEEAVVFGVRDLGRGLDVIEPVVPLDRAPQLLGLRLQVARNGAVHGGCREERQEKRRRARALPAGMPCASMPRTTSSSERRIEASPASVRGLRLSSTSCPPSVPAMRPASSTISSNAPAASSARGTSSAKV